MSYHFNGLISDHPIQPSSLWDPSCHFTDFQEPFPGTIIRVHGHLTQEAWTALTATAQKWSQANPKVRLLALDYDTWAGRIDWCEGFVIHEGTVGSTLHGDGRKAGDVFTTLFAALGKPLTDTYFPPLAGSVRSSRV